MQYVIVVCYTLQLEIEIIGMFEIEKNIFFLRAELGLPPRTSRSCGG